MMPLIKSYLDLCRVSNLPTVWTNVLAAVVLSNTPFSWSSFLILSLTHTFFYTGGMCLNDLCDITQDRVHKPFRPLPSQKISIRNATLFIGVLFGLALFSLLFVPHPRAFYLGLILLVFIITYDWFHKGHPFTVFLMAACRLMVFVISGMAISGKVGMAVWIGGFIQFIYILILSLVARYENSLKEGFSFPVIPMMIASISILDGIMMVGFASSFWLLAGMSGAVLTHLGQRYVRGD